MGEIVIKYAQRVFWIFVDREKLENFVVIYRNMMWGTKNGPLGLVEKGLSSSTF